MGKGIGKKEDYVGPLDGDPSSWMTRKTTDKGSNLKIQMVPQASKPSEAGDFFESFDRGKYNNENRNKGSMDTGKGDAPFLKHTTTGKC